MTPTDLSYLSAADLAALIAARKVSPVEIMDALLPRIAASQPVLNAFITVTADAARAEAKAAEAAVMRGDRLGPLHGVPFSVKDLVNTAGVRTTFASHILENNVPAADAPSVARMKASGAILVGKTTTPEFGHKPLNEAPIFGRTANPWDLRRTCGGSSGGSGAAVAAGLGPLSIGTDAGGSIRIPAACTGTVGMKATLGLVPNESAADGFANFSNVGPQSRTVLDSAFMLNAMAGPDPRDPHSIGLPAVDFVAAACDRRDLRGLRIAYIRRMGNEVIDTEVERLVDAAAASLAGMGATVEPFAPEFTNTEPHWLVISQSLWVARFGKYLPNWENRMTPTLVRGIKEGMEYTAARLQEAAVFRTNLFRQVQSWFERFDLLVMPTISRTAIPIDHDFYAPVEINGQKVGKLRQHWYPYTHPFNMTGHPAISLPCGFHSDGLPVGLQIVARPAEDALAIRAAARYEAAHDWMARRPNLPQLDG